MTLSEIIKDNPLLHLGSDEIFHYGRIEFEIPPLDKLTGGGIPKKRITIITGPTNVGKSYLASQLVKALQEKGGVAAWIDNEVSWDPQWMAKCGVDCDNIIVAQPTTGEETFDLIKTLMQSKVDLIVLDSIAGIVPAVLQDEDFSYNPMAWQARFMNQSLPKLMPYLKHGAALMAINQVRSSLGPVSLEAMPGGMAQTFFSHFILNVRRRGWIKEKDERIGFDIEVRCRKTKVGGMPYGDCIVPFRLEGGIDMVEHQIRELLNTKRIQKKGAWYKVGDEEKPVQGMNGLRELFQEKPELLEALSGDLGDEEEA